jgi:hypothetical protein
MDPYEEFLKKFSPKVLDKIKRHKLSKDQMKEKVGILHCLNDTTQNRKDKSTISPFNSLLYHLIMKDKLQELLFKDKVTIRILYTFKFLNEHTSINSIKFECEEIKLIDNYSIEKIIKLFIEALRISNNPCHWFFKNINSLPDEFKIVTVQYNFIDETSIIKNVTWDRQRELQFTELVNKELQNLININQKNKNMDKNQNLSLESALSTLDKLSEITSKPGMKEHITQMNTLIILTMSTIGLLLGSSEVKTDATQTKLSLNEEKPTINLKDKIEEKTKIKEEKKEMLYPKESETKKQEESKEKKKDSDITKNKVTEKADKETESKVLYNEIQTHDNIIGQILNVINGTEGKTDLDKSEKEVIKGMLFAAGTDGQKINFNKINFTLNKGNVDGVVKNAVIEAKTKLKEELIAKVISTDKNKEAIIAKAEKAAAEGKEDLGEEQNATIDQNTTVIKETQAKVPTTIVGETAGNVILQKNGSEDKELTEEELEAKIEAELKAEDDAKLKLGEQTSAKTATALKETQEPAGKKPEKNGEAPLKDSKTVNQEATTQSSPVNSSTDPIPGNTTEKNTTVSNVKNLNSDENKTSEATNDIEGFISEQTYKEAESLEELVNYLKQDSIEPGAFDRENSITLEMSDGTFEEIMLNSYAVKMFRSARSVDPKYIGSGQVKATVVCHNDYYNEIMENGETASDKAISNKELTLFIDKLLASKQFSEIEFAEAV